MADETVEPTPATAPDTKMNARFDDYVRAGLCYIVVGGYVASYLYGQVTGHNPAASEINTYSNYAMLALGFYLGSSAGSALKDKAKS
jgi:hypothetical protein